MEEKADDAATMLLDLADHDLADTKLQRAVGLGERIETLLNAIVSSSFEYRDTLDGQSTGIIEKEISNSQTEMTASINDVISELSANGLTGTVEELESTFNDVNNLISGDDSIFNNKLLQLNAIDEATKMLAAADNDIQAANSILVQQVNLANETTLEVQAAVEGAVEGEVKEGAAATDDKKEEGKEKSTKPADDKSKGTSADKGQSQKKETKKK